MIVKGKCSSQKLELPVSCPWHAPVFMGAPPSTFFIANIIVFLPFKEEVSDLRFSETLKIAILATPVVIYMLLSRTLTEWQFWNFGVFEKNRNIIRICFCFNPRCGIWGCFRLSTAADYDLPHALARALFCQLQIVSARVWCLEFWGLFRGVYKC